LIKTHANNISPHKSVDNWILSADSGITCNSWSFSSESNGTQNIHDEVDPEHLNNVQWNSSECTSTDNSNEANSNVNGQLELNELSDIIKNSSTVFNRSIDRKEIVI